MGEGYNPDGGVVGAVGEGLSGRQPRYGDDPDLVFGGIFGILFSKSLRIVCLFVCLCMRVCEGLCHKVRVYVCFIN